MRGAAPLHDHVMNLLWLLAVITASYCEGDVDGDIDRVGKVGGLIEVKETQLTVSFSGGKYWQSHS